MRLSGVLGIVAAVAAPSVCPFVPGVEAQQDPIPLEGLVVTATPVPMELSALGTHVTLLEGDELRARGIIRVADALREVPGLVVVENGPEGSVASVFFRGGESDYVQVLVDGVQVNQPGGSFDFSGLTAAAVERIEVVRGPVSALHGSDAVSGVVHVVTRDGLGAAPASFAFRGGSHGRRDATLTAGGGSETASYAVTLGRYFTDGILEFNNAHENSVFSGKAAVRLDDGTRIRLAGRWGRRTYHFPTDFTGAAVDANQFTFSDESSLSAEIERGLGHAVRLRALVTAFGFEGGTDDSPDGAADTLGFYGFQSLDAYRRSALDVRANVVLTPRATGTIGVEFEAQRVRSFSESLSQFGSTTGRSVNDRSNRAGYFHLAFAGGRIGANGGVRLEDNEYYGRFLSWQTGASVALSQTLRLRGAAGRGLKEPTFLETFATGFLVGNRDLDPEISTSWELGAEYVSPGGGVSMQATWFRQRFRDLVQYTAVPTVPGGANFFNVAAARVRGVEGSVEVRLADWRLAADATWLDTEVIDAGFDEGPGAAFVEGEPLLRRPGSSVGVGTGWSPVRRLRVDLSARRIGSRADRDFSTFPATPVELEAYLRADLSAEAVVREATRGGFGLTLRAEVRNLGDARFSEVHGFPAPGRSFFIGGRVTAGD